ncbi:MAG: hypothetical protein R3E79_51945 [Caldilineaceae bacterium]
MLSTWAAALAGIAYAQPDLGETGLGARGLYRLRHGCGRTLGLGISAGGCHCACSTKRWPWVKLGQGFARETSDNERICLAYRRRCSATAGSLGDTPVRAKSDQACASAS